MYKRHKVIYVRGCMVVDILSPVGGRGGGIENVIKSWVENLSDGKTTVRVIHMAPGTAYLGGYEYAYAFPEYTGDDMHGRLEYSAKIYAKFMIGYGKPDVCVATNWPAVCMSADAARRALGADYRIISWVHSGIAEYEKAGLGGVESMLCADEHLCINGNIQRAILERAPQAVTHLVGNPVKMQEFIEKSSDERLLCCVGRLDEEKRIDIILEALYRAKHRWKLRIVGSGACEDELKKISSYLQLDDDVEFAGWQEEPWECCRGASALVAASMYEGFMLTGVEAMSMGMTVISTPVEGLIDYLKPGVNGYLYEKEDAVGLAQLLDMIYEGELPLCDRQTCRETALKYSEENYFDKVKSILYN